MLQLVDVEKVYGAGSASVRALHDINLKIADGEFCAVVGPSGSGKSTLMNILGLLDRPTAGEMFIDGAAAPAGAGAAARLRNRRQGFVFQSFNLLPRLSLWENVALPLLYRGIGRAARQAAAERALTQVGLTGFATRRPAELSGGQAQRAAIARALAGEPRLVLADEPTGSLDQHTAAEVLSLFQATCRAAGVTVVLITHDPALARRCPRRLEIVDGRIARDSAAAA